MPQVSQPVNAGARIGSPGNLTSKSRVKCPQVSEPSGVQDDSLLTPRGILGKAHLETSALTVHGHAYLTWPRLPDMATPSTPNSKLALTFLFLLSYQARGLEVKN